jgi:hypothetical protein
LSCLSDWLAADLAQAAPISGALYARFGWKAPHIFSIVGVGLDLVARLLIVEGGPQENLPADLEMDNRSPGHSAVDLVALSSITSQLVETSPQFKSDVEPPVAPVSCDPEDSASVNPESGSIERSLQAQPNVPLWRILINIAKCPRGASGFAMTFVFGLTLGTQDSTSDPVYLPRYFQLMLQADAVCPDHLA